MNRLKFLIPIILLNIGSAISQSIISYECVSEDRLELIVDQSYNATGIYYRVRIDDCDHIITRNFSKEAISNIETKLIIEANPNSPFFCPNGFSGIITILNSSYDEIFSTVFIDEEDVDPNDVVSPSTVVSYCNNNIKEVIAKGVSTGELDIEGCPQWNGDCGIDGVVWREGTLIGSEHDNISNVPGLKIDLRKEAVLTEEFKVCNIGANGWCDYVFDPTYDLMPLPKVSEFIQKNKRLPNMPSESEVVLNAGFKVDDIIVRQQEKIEELYLYIIDVEEKLSKLTGESALLEEVKENYRYGMIESQNQELDMEEVSEMVSPAIDIPCVPIDCEALTSEGSNQLTELVREELSSSKCSKWEEAGSTRRRLGPVGIGTNIVPNGFNLSVDGDVIFGELYVMLCTEWGWCDYVFEEEYKIPNLPSTKKFILENQRLPNIPSTETLNLDGGLLVKQITVLQQEKIEELYVHLFELTNRLTNYKKNNNE